MATLSIQEVAGYAARAGFTGDDLVKIIAIAAGESGFRTDARNPSSGAVGLWQILPSAHPEFAGQNLTDPAVNAAAAYSVYRSAPNPGQITKNKWSAYGGLTYISMYPAAQLAATHATQGAVAGAAESALGTAGQTGAAITSVGNKAIDAWNMVSNPRFWLRAALVVVGGGLVVASLNRLVIRQAMGSDAGRAVIGATKKVVTKGAA